MKRLTFLNTQMCQFEWEYRVERVGTAGRLSPPRYTNEALLDAYHRLVSQSKLCWTPIAASIHNRSSAGRLSPPRITIEAPLDAYRRLESQTKLRWKLIISLLNSHKQKTGTSQEVPANPNQMYSIRVYLHSSAPV